MSDSSFTRRDVLMTTAAVIGMAALEKAAGQPIAAAAAAKAPTSRPAPTIGIQMTPGALAEGDIDRLMDDLQSRAGVNALFPFIFSYSPVTAGLPPSRGFHGGNYADVHMQYYRHTSLTYADMRAPELGNLDVLARTIPAAKKRGIKTFAWVLEHHGRVPLPDWQPLYEIDFHGRRAQAHPAGPCYNNPLYTGFVLGLIEDYTRSYDIDGVMWSSERQGGLFNALGAYHHGASADPGRATCFCEFCQKRAAASGINVKRAFMAFEALETFVRAGRARRRPNDGYFVEFFRLLLKYPELLAWEMLWIDSRQDLMRNIHRLVKSIKPQLPVGWHIWHNVSFSPFHRAEMDYSVMAEYSDFLKPVLYSNCAGERMHSFTDSVCGDLFADVPPAQTLEVLYRFLNYTHEAPYDRLTAAGFSPDYVRRETRRAVDDVPAAVQVWPGIDVDVPVPRGAGHVTAEKVKASVLAAFEGGASGVILSRNYNEMNPDHLAGAMAALKQLGLR
jgi:hypothetical protein